MGYKSTAAYLIMTWDASRQSCASVVPDFKSSLQLSLANARYKYFYSSSRSPEY